MINGYVRTFKLKLTCRLCKILHCIALAKTVMSMSFQLCFIEAVATFNPQGNMLQCKTCGRSDSYQLKQDLMYEYNERI